jgi:outer membrane protein assembly factor BamB
MKYLKLTVLFSGMIVLASSCRKNDFAAEVPTEISIPTATDVKWISLTNWSSKQSENTTTFFNRVSDTSITYSVAKAGMILVYKKDGSSIKALPLQDGTVSWNYQVSTGALLINSENNDGSNLSKSGFSYFIITPEKLSALQAGGKTRMDLLNLSYEQAADLLK